MRCNGFKRKNFFGQTEMHRTPGLHLARSEVLGRQLAAAAAKRGMEVTLGSQALAALSRGRQAVNPQM